jgi:hypothetical protein
MTIASAYPQMLPKLLINPIEDKLQIQCYRNLQVNPPLIRNGIYGDNKMYQPQTIKGYKQAFQQLGQ